MVDIYTNKFEVALFPKDLPSTIDFASISEEIKKQTGLFDSDENLVLPVPADAPIQFVRIYLRSKDGSIGCNISAEKVNIFWLNSLSNIKYSVSLKTIEDIVEKISKIILDNTPTKTIHRIGYIKEIFFTSDNPATTLKGHVIVGDKVDDLDKFYLQFTYPLKLDGISKNVERFVTLASGRKDLPEQKRVIILSYDINTVPNQKIKWNFNQIKLFIKKADKKTNVKDMYRYFFK